MHFQVCGWEEKERNTHALTRLTSPGGAGRGCYTPFRKTRTNSVLKYQSLDQSLVQYIIQVVHSHTTLLFKYKTLQHDDDIH
jgi:hypothetical protein